MQVGYIGCTSDGTLCVSVDRQAASTLIALLDEVEKRGLSLATCSEGVVARAHLSDARNAAELRDDVRAAVALRDQQLAERIAGRKVRA